MVNRKDVSKTSNILNGRFILSIKDERTSGEVWKARFVAQGRKDNMKQFLEHSKSGARQQSKKLLDGMAAIFEFRLFATDVAQAYLQSSERIMRDVYVN